MSAAEQLQILFQGEDQLSGTAAKVGTALGEVGTKAKEAEGGFGVFTAALEHMQTIALGFAEGAFIVKGMEAITEVIPKAMEKIEALGDDTRKLMLETGATAEQASELLGVMDRFGVSGGQASTAMAIFEKHLAGVESAEAGGKEGADKFAMTMENLGVKTSDAAGKTRPVIDVLLDFAEGIKTLGPGIDAMGAISDAFSVRAGKNFVEFFMQGREGIQKLMDLQKEYGAYLTEENVQELYQDEQAHKSLDAAVTGLQIRLGMELMPTLTDVTKGMTLFTAAMGDATKSSDGFQAANDASIWTKLSVGADATGRAVLGLGGIIKDSITNWIEQGAGYAAMAVSLLGDVAAAGKAALAFDMGGYNKAVDDLAEHTKTGMDAMEDLTKRHGEKIQGDLAAIGNAALNANRDYAKSLGEISDATKAVGAEEAKRLATTQAGLVKLGGEMDTVAKKITEDKVKVSEFAEEEGKAQDTRAEKIRKVQEGITQTYGDSIKAMTRHQQDWALDLSKILEDTASKQKTITEQETKAYKSYNDSKEAIDKQLMTGQTFERNAQFHAELDALEKKKTEDDKAFAAEQAALDKETAAKLAALDLMKKRAIEDFNESNLRAFNKAKEEVTQADWARDRGIAAIEDRKTKAVTAMNDEIKKIGELQGKYDELGKHVGAAAPSGGGGGGDWLSTVFQPGKQRAAGGPVTAGESYLIGEHGRPEIFTPGASGFVTPAGGGGAVTINLMVQGSVVTQNDLVTGIRQAMAYDQARGVTSFNVNGA